MEGSAGSRALASGQELTFDCMEIVNSDAEDSPPRTVLPAWFALLERGRFFPFVKR